MDAVLGGVEPRALADLLHQRRAVFGVVGNGVCRFWVAATGSHESPGKQYEVSFHVAKLQKKN
jgi:hypothetical protein